jgi:Ser/Thr protein kinase RdoA (MazF antagonist)
VDTVSDEAADVERPLTGGRLTAGVVQVGDTVRRPASAASRFVARLLTCLAEKGFDGCPRHLGRDDQGRDVLSFLPGHVPARWRRFNDTQIRAAAAMLRRMHDTTRDLATEIGSGEVICHHDPGPNNTIFRNGHPVAFIDFDFAAPGQPIEDLAYMAWAWCLSSRPDRGPATEQARQVRVLADAYGLGHADRQLVPGAIHQRLLRNETFWRYVLQDPRLPQDRYLRATETLEWTRREFRHVETHQAILMGAVSR